MRKLLWVVSFLALSAPVAAQNEIPNAGMETWDSTVVWLPQQWQLVQGASRVTGHSGSYACQLVNTVGSNNSNPGVVLDGYTNNGVQFTGGISFTQRPDSIIAYFKYHIVAGDTAFFLVLLKKQGTSLCFQWLPIAANGAVASTFTRIAKKITYSDTNKTHLPDSLIVGVICTNPNKKGSSPAGDTLTVDDISFHGATTAVPNGTFETWNSLFSYSPVGWYGYAGGSDDTVFSLHRTTDKYAGKYAALIQNFISTTDTISGIAGTTPNQDSTYTAPSFKVSQRYTNFSFAYKYLPQNGDSMGANVLFFKNHSQIGGYTYFSGAAATVWTQGSIPINYYNDPTGVAVPDSATISFGACNNQPKGNSTLYIDNLSFATTSVRWYPTTPALGSNNFTANLDAQGRQLSVTFQSGTGVHVAIRLLNLSGREINELLNQTVSKGAYMITFDASHLSRGIYLVEKKAGSSVETKRIVVAR